MLQPFQKAMSRTPQLRRFLWSLSWNVLYRTSPRPCHAWRAALLRLFGAQLGPNCHFYPGVHLLAPWNLVCADGVAAGDGVYILNQALLHLRSHVILSQGSLIASALPDEETVYGSTQPGVMTVEAYAWICAKACVSPGVNVGEGAVLGLASVAVHDLEAWTVYSGSPAIRVKDRKRFVPGSL